MGSTLSAETSNKLRLADKTHVLNLSDGGFKTSSEAVWSKVIMVDPKLKSLDLSGNNFAKGVPDVIHVFISLKSLALSRCSLVAIADLSHFGNLTVLKLDHNKLDNSGLVCLPESLTQVDLSYNSFSTVPLVLLSLFNLKELNLSHNKLETLVTLEACISLTSIDCDNNLIEYVPQTLSALRDLKSLSLRHNRLVARLPNGDQSIPASFFQETSIQSLNLEGNSLLSNKAVSEFNGAEFFMARRQSIKQKNLQGGAITDFSVFGLD
jgi:Leucine-rich repeat (LRR) protein